MKVWMIWVQANDDGYTWIEEAWTDDQTSENQAGWLERVKIHEHNALANNTTVRIQAVNVPGVLELFEVPEVTAFAEGENA